MRKLAVLAAVVVVVLVAAGVLSNSLLSPITSNRATSTGSSSTGLRTLPVLVSEESGGLRPGVTVSGEGIIAVKPDLARVTLGVEVSNPSASTAQQEAAAKMDSVIGQLKKLGIQEKDIQTVRFDLSPEYDQSSRTPVLKGYRVTNLVAVTVRDMSKVGGLLDSVVASEATRLHGIGFSVSDPAAAGSQGREEAMKSARSKAEHLAKLAGVSLGPAVAIEEAVSAPPEAVEIQQRGAVAAAPATPISPGTQEVRTVVRVTYSLR